MFDNDQLIKEFSLENLTPEAQEQQIAQIRAILQLRIGAKLADAMTEEQQAALEELVNGNKDEEALNWIVTNFPDYQQQIVEELQALKQETTDAASKWTSTSSPDSL